MRSAEAKRFEVMKTTDRGSAHLSTPDSHQALCIRVEKFYLVEFVAIRERLRLYEIRTAELNSTRQIRVGTQGTASNVVLCFCLDLIRQFVRRCEMGKSCDLLMMLRVTFPWLDSSESNYDLAP
jgi:hypothetical protein